MVSLDQLIQLIRDNSQPIATRRAAVVQIAEIGGLEAYPHLVTALSDPAPGVRREAANALQKNNFVEATTALEEAVKNEDSDLTRWDIIEALGIIGTLSALPTLQTLLNEELSPLTRREIQKSIDLINIRHPDDQVLESIEETKTNENDIESDSEATESSLSVSDQDSLNDEKTEDDSQTGATDLDENTVDRPDNERRVDEEIQYDEPAVTTIDPDFDPVVETSEAATDAETSTDTKSTDPDSERDSVIDVESGIEQSGVEQSGRTTLAPALPVLVPNTSVVIYEQEETKNKPSFYALVLRPNMYLSKRWVSRSRLYFTLLFLLLGATITLIYSQVQRQPGSPYKPNAELVYMENAEDYIATGSLYMQQGDYRRAIEEFEFVRGVEAVDYTLYKNLGDAYFVEKLYAHAVEAYEYYLVAREIHPYQLFVAEASFSTNSLREEQQISADYKTYNRLGSAYKRLGLYDNAHDSFEKAIELAPKESDAFNNLAKLYSEGYQQKPKLTLGLAYASVILNPFVASSHDIVGWTLGKNRRYNSATNALEQAFRLQSDYVPMLYHFAEIADKTPHPDKTLEYVEMELRQKTRRNNLTRTDILDVLSYFYENESQRFSRFNASLYRQRGLE